MTVDPVSFTKPSASCSACAGELAEGQETRFDLALAPGTSIVALCATCAARVADDGRPPPPLVPEFRAMPSLKTPGVTRRDLLLVLDALAATAEPLDDAVRALLARTREPKLADLDAWLARLAAGGRRPPALDLAGALVSGALLDIEPGTFDELARMADRAGSSDEFELAIGAAFAALGLAAKQRPDAPPAHAQRLLELADRRFLLASLPVAHPLAVRARAMRLSIALARGRTDVVDAALARAPLGDARMHLLRGVRAAQQGNLWAADREFLLACNAQGVAEDDEILALALWNRAARAFAATRWPEGKDALRAYARLQAHDRSARLALGHAYVRCAMHAVAREALASVLDAGAMEHMEGLVTGDGLDPQARAEGVALYACCLLELGEPARAAAALTKELESEHGGGSRAPELHRLLARCAMLDARPERALDALAKAWLDVKSQALAHELAFAATSAARDALTLHGLAGLRALVERGVIPFDALRTHHGALSAFLFATFCSSQIRDGFKPAHGFGLDWNWLKLQGADARTSTVQAYSALARHQAPAAMRHDLGAVNSGGASVPFALIAALFRAAREAPRDEVELLLAALDELASVSRRELGGG